MNGLRVLFAAPLSPACGTNSLKLAQTAYALRDDRLLNNIINMVLRCRFRMFLHAGAQTSGSWTVQTLFFAPALWRYRASGGRWKVLLRAASSPHLHRRWRASLWFVLCLSVFAPRSHCPRVSSSLGSAAAWTSLADLFGTHRAMTHGPRRSADPYTPPHPCPPILPTPYLYLLCPFISLRIAHLFPHYLRRGSALRLCSPHLPFPSLDLLLILVRWRGMVWRTAGRTKGRQRRTAKTKNVGCNSGKTSHPYPPYLPHTTPPCPLPTFPHTALPLPVVFPGSVNRRQTNERPGVAAAPRLSAFSRGST